MAQNQKFTTHSVLESRSARVYLFPDSDSRHISSSSRFGDSSWQFDSLTPGQHRSRRTIGWNFSLNGNSSFGAPEHRALLNACKVFVWSLFCDPRNGRSLSAGTVPHLQRGLRCLVRWMVRNGFRSFAELDAAASEDFLHDLLDMQLRSEKLGVEDLASEASDEANETTLEIGEGAIRPYVTIWSLLWRQSDALRDAGVLPLAARPFGGRSAKDISVSFATKAASWIEPVPDEVALPIMAAAHRMIGTPADDVIELHRRYVSALSAVEHCCSGYQNAVCSAAIEHFKFSKCPGEDKPWRDPVERGQGLTLFMGTWRTAHHGVAQLLRKLIEHVCAACVITLQSETGMRVNEICGLKSGVDSTTGLPSCISVRSSRSDLHELYFLKGTIAKMYSSPVPAEWLLGSRPKGSSDVPVPVRSLCILNELFKLLRSRNDSLQNELILAFESFSYPRNPSRLKKVQAFQLRRLQREFVGTYVDLSGLPRTNKHGQDLSSYIATRGACLKTHSWRKTFALYVFRTDPRMIPAIAQQFHHLTLAMTDEGYIGSDPTLLEAMDSVRTKQTGNFFYEMVRGHRPMAGRLAKFLDEHLADLERVVSDLSEKPAREAMEQWVIKQDLRIFYASHGKCFLPLSPLKARCHEAAGTAHWSNPIPNYSFRSPETCLGCPLFAIDGEHEEFWVRRYVENMSSWVAANEKQLHAQYRLSEYRAIQSAAVLQAIGAGLPEIPKEAEYVTTKTC